MLTTNNRFINNSSSLSIRKINHLTQKSSIQDHSRSKSKASQDIAAKSHLNSTINQTKKMTLVKDSAPNLKRIQSPTPPS